ncbi:MAG: histidine phosphatase family protein [Desulfuromonadales bacterium]
MELYLMQHGQAVPESENPEKPLSREGVAQIQASAAAMRKLGISLDTLIHSPKKRAKQTAALIAEALNYPHSDLVETELVEPPPRSTSTSKMAVSAVWMWSACRPARASCGIT